jgi:retinol dehydrogenase-13
MTESIVVVTGANTGIGFETAVGVAEAGAYVVMTSRDRARGEAALAELRRRTGSTSAEVLPLDLASFASIHEFVREFDERHDRLDVLVHNAGVAPAGRRWETQEGFEATIGVNHIGPFLLTSLLLDKLRASAPSRVVVVSSGAYAFASQGICFDDLHHERAFHSFRVYAESKLANLLFAQELARRLEGTGVTVNALNPGYIDTQLGKIRPEDLARAQERPQPGAGGGAPGAPLPAAVGARTSVLLAMEPTLEGHSGRYYSQEEEAELLPHATDQAAAARLWSVTEALVSANDRESRR